MNLNLRLVALPVSFLATLAFAGFPIPVTAKALQKSGGDTATKTGKSYFIGGWGGRGQLILGSSDPRVTGGFSFGYGMPDPRLRYHHIPGQFMREFYIQRSHSGGTNEPRNDANAIGFLPYGRWRFATGRGFGFYFDAGLGVQYQDRTSVDLDLKLNTTPMLGAGVATRVGDTEVLYGIRLLHISNGGRRKPNNGSNQLLLTVFVRF